jgi:hypothetical protein
MPWMNVDVRRRNTGSPFVEDLIWDLEQGFAYVAATSGRAPLSGSQAGRSEVATT